MSSAEIFDNVLPLPYRVLTLILLASWLWLLILRLTQKYQINLIQILKLDTPNLAQLIANHEKTSLNITLLTLSSYLFYVILHKYFEWEILWNVTPLVIMIVMISHITRSLRVLETVKRVLRGNIDSINIRTNDILLSDTLMSYQKVLIDLGIYLCHLINFKSCMPNDQTNIDRTCGQSVALEFFIGGLPVFIRLKQCAYEYRLSNFIQKDHLFNFGKYLTGLIFLAITIFLSNHPHYGKIWKIVAFINSCYSFYWDLNKDWGLFKTGSLRTRRVYPIYYYYSIIAIDFFARFVWVLKLSSKDIFINVLLYQSESGIFILQLLEILRRFLWVILKIENDYINLNLLDKRSIELSVLN
ncbi:hypothetical protein WICMUC_003381 [Wickerhamomyces mucosus]|uniref:EXS domain-containing protein n=1 Tax=Wickerhamomyces mucosus TaxID=1378264 RepID=A0A9P8PMT3_9ASCO|nr:hypothetical protein WICMUC_003381 [Wickerhamomyces mucosus]